MKFAVTVLMSLVLGYAAQASDHWDSCRSADGYVSMDNGILSIDGIGEIASESVSVKIISTIKQEQEKCILEGYNHEVIAYDNTVTVEEVTYTMEENDAPSKVIVLCEKGGSGIPANGNCKN